MAVRIRLKRYGKKKKPFYRLVVADSRTPRDGRDLEIVGLYDPTKDPIYVELKQDRITHWLSVGAQPSETANRILASQGLVAAVARTSSELGVSKKDRKAAKTK